MSNLTWEGAMQKNKQKKQQLWFVFLGNAQSELTDEQIEAWKAV